MRYPPIKDPAADGKESNIIRFFTLFPDGARQKQLDALRTLVKRAKRKAIEDYVRNYIEANL